MRTGREEAYAALREMTVESRRSFAVRIIVPSFEVDSCFQKMEVQGAIPEVYLAFDGRGYA